MNKLYHEIAYCAASRASSAASQSCSALTRAASIAKQAVDKNLITKSDFGINPGSEQVRYTAERDGILKIFEDLNATIFTNACGPCIGQWDRSDLKGQENMQKVNKITIRLRKTVCKIKKKTNKSRCSQEICGILNGNRRK